MTDEISVFVDIDELTAQYGLAETWKARMEAVCAGVVDYDDAWHFVHLCAATADQALKKEYDARKTQGIPHGPWWRQVLEGFADTVLTGNDTSGEPSAELVRCGEEADAVEERGGLPLRYSSLAKPSS